MPHEGVVRRIRFHSGSWRRFPPKIVIRGVTVGSERDSLAAQRVSYSLLNRFSAAHDSLLWAMSVSERSRYFHGAGASPEAFT